MKTIIAALVGTVALTTTACTQSTGERSQTSGASTPPPVEADASTQIACRDLARANKDATDGIINVQELRQRLIIVNNNARLSEDPQIVEQSRLALAAITRNVPDYDSIVALTKRCGELVWNR